MPSIYTWTNLITNKQYVGQTKNASFKRKNQHITDFNRVKQNIIRSTALYDAMLQFGFENFEFLEMFYVFDKSDLDYYEKLIISDLKSFEDGYNRTGGGSGDTACSEYTKNLRSSETKKLWESTEFREKIANTKGSLARSGAAKERWANDEYRANRRNSHSIAVNKAEYKKKQSEAKKKMWADENRREEIIRLQNEGRKNPEFKAKRSELTKRMVDEGKFTSKKKCSCNGIEYASQKEALIALSIGQRKFYTLLKSGIVKYL